MMAPRRVPIAATLALADGKIFEGVSVGAEGECSGEVVFNTALTGYQEILTDPSYCGQILTFTCPHIGNVGVNPEDQESLKIHLSGLVVREFSEVSSNYRASSTLADYLKANSVVGIGGIDTRALVLHLREHGSQMGIIATGQVKRSELVDRARVLPRMAGLDLVPRVTTSKSYSWHQASWIAARGCPELAAAELAGRPLVVAIDFGIKFNILRLMVDQGFAVKVVPATTSAQEIMRLKPAGVFLSNGPGDPAAVHYGISCIRELLGKVPIFGICLGHQLLSLAMGAQTFKLPFGHRGGNHPVRQTKTGKVEITVQNHGFAVQLSKGEIPGLEISHINLNDGTVEGVAVPEAAAFAVQYHPECSPGPHDSRYLFRHFRELVAQHA